MTVRIYGFTPPARLDAYRNFTTQPAHLRWLTASPTNDLDSLNSTDQSASQEQETGVS